MVKTFDELREGYPIAFGEFMEDLEKELGRKTQQYIKRKEEEDRRTEKHVEKQQSKED